MRDFVKREISTGRFFPVKAWGLSKWDDSIKISKYGKRWQVSQLNKYRIEADGAVTYLGKW